MSVRAIKLPDIGEGITEAELVEWHVREGQMVAEDDLLAEVMTDKATVEIPSICAGRIARLAGAVGDKLAVGTEFVFIETDAVAEARASAPSAAAPPAAPPAIAPAEPLEVAIQRAASAAPLASPSVRKRAKENGIDLRQVSGTGPSGRVTRSDLDALLAPGAAPDKGAATDRVIKVTGLRRQIAERMARANASIPHITVIEEVDVTALEDLRAKLNETRGERPKLTMLPLILAALVRALRDRPEMNARFDEAAGTVTQHGAVHAGIATMTDAGLMVPVLRDAQDLGLFDTAAELARLAAAARSGKARRDELTGSTITLTSLGPLGALATTPIVNPPEVAILGINRMAIRPHWDGAQFVPRKMMNVSASFDHRIIDGWNAAMFVQGIKSLLETPALIFAKV